MLETARLERACLDLPKEKAKVAEEQAKAILNSAEAAASKLISSAEEIRSAKRREVDSLERKASLLEKEIARMEAHRTKMMSDHPDLVNVIESGEDMEVIHFSTSYNPRTGADVATQVNEWLQTEGRNFTDINISYARDQGSTYAWVTARRYRPNDPSSEVVNTTE
jgi:hypothetical protein